MQSMIGLAQCGLIWMGLKQMSRSSELREREGARRHEEVVKNHAESMNNHEESMTALKTLNRADSEVTPAFRQPYRLRPPGRGSFFAQSLLCYSSTGW